MMNKCCNNLFKWVLILVMVSACADDAWQGSVKQDGDVTVIQNPDISLWPEGKIELVEELAIGNDEDEKQMFFRIRAVRISQSGDICILDAGNHRVVVFDKNGDYKFAFGKPGSGPDEFRDPFGMALDKAGNFYVIDRGTRRIDKFNANGEHLTSSPFESWATWLEVLSENIVLLSEMRPSQIGAFGRVVDLQTDSVLFELALPFDFELGPTRPRSTVSLEEKYQVLRDGRIYLAVPFPYEIRRYDTSGQLDKRITKKDSRIEKPDIQIFNEGRSISITEKGRAGPCFLTGDGLLLNNCTWFSKEGKTKNAIDVFDESGKYLGTVELASTQRLIAVGQNNLLYLHDEEPMERIVRVRLDVQS